jgi:acyl-CoA thioesterase-2
MSSSVTAKGQLLVDYLVELLDLERIELDIFRGYSPAESPVRVFGGQVAGQALVAAGRTVDADRVVHSLHSYFIRPGDPSTPIIYTVDRVRDGRSFSTRRVVAIQHGQAIFSLSASFQLAAVGLDHQSPMPVTPPPDTLPTADERAAELAARGLPPERPLKDWPFDLRTVPASGTDRDSVGNGHYLVWMKAAGRLPDDALLHACVLTFASDLTQLNTVVRHHGLGGDLDAVKMASLDHAVWFHRPFRADDWLLYEQESPSASGGRGLSNGRVFAQDGRHVATVMQEGMIRLALPRS